MISDHETQKILDSLGLLDKLFDFARLVDPIEKREYCLEKGSFIVQENSCFNFWKRKSICENCISMRALNENKTFVKMEYAPDLIYMVTAVPIEINNRKVAIELLKNITDNITLENSSQGVDSEIYHLIDNLQRITLKDTLTGVYNRRYINERLPADIINAVMTGQSMSIIMADIDHFKKINDTYGHSIGDMVLREFAQKLSGNLKRHGDWVARYGGEEFLICIPGSDLGDAEKIAERLRVAVEENVVNWDTVPLRVTASFGVSAIDNIKVKDISSFLEQADKKLYSAKQNGRNRVEA